MNYKYPPIYKYGLLLLTIYMFIKHQKILTPDKILFNSVLIVLIIFIFDNVIIKDHPTLLEENKKNTNNFDEEDEFENELSDDELEEIIRSYDHDIESRYGTRDNRRENDHYRNHGNHNDLNQININLRRPQFEHERNYYDSGMLLQ